MDRGLHLAVSQVVYVGTVAALLIVLGVIGLVALYANNQQQNNITNLNSSLNSLQTDYNTLNSEYVNLSSSYSALQNSFSLLTANMSSLQSQYNFLNSNYTSLTASYVSLNSTYIGLQHNYTSLQANYTSLLANYTSLQANYTSLLANYTSLNSSYASLQQLYTYLQGNYTASQNIVNFNNSTTLATNLVLVIPRAENQNLTYSTPYGGYLSISFVATRGALIEFSNSNYTAIYAQYPLTGSAASGTFRMPVFPGSEKITIQDEPLISDIGPLSFAINITYVY